MSRTTVRNAIGAYLSTPSLVTHLTTVFKHPPKVTNEGDILGNDGSGSGAAIYIHLAAQHEIRIALGGPTNGQKMRPYTCSLICIFRSVQPQTEQVGADNDTFLDSLIAAIEADRNAGNPGVVFQWGEGDALYGADIKVRTELPREIDLGISQVFSVLEVTVLEEFNT